MQEKEGERALGVSEVTSLTVMRDARGHRGILKSWFHNKWWFCFFRAKCGLPHYSLKTVGWCRTTDGLLDPKSQAGFHKLLPSKYKHMVAVLAVKCFKMANVVSITRTKEARESRNDWTIYKQDGASVGAFLVKTFVCEWVQWPTGSCKKTSSAKRLIQPRSVTSTVFDDTGWVVTTQTSSQKDFISKSRSEITTSGIQMQRTGGV